MIIEHIDKHYLEKQGNKKARDGKLYVSDIGGCSRQIYFEIKAMNLRNVSQRLKELSKPGISSIRDC